MKSLIVVIILCSTTTLSAIGFETDRVKEIYALLPDSIAALIDVAERNGTVALDVDSGATVSLLYKFNVDKQLSHIGVDLNNAMFRQTSFAEAYQFLEYAVLHLGLLHSNKERKEFAEKMQLNFYHNGTPVEINNRFLSFVEKMSRMKFSLAHNDYYFQAIWTSADSLDNNFEIRFPAVITLLKGMDKAEMEENFLRELNEVDSCGYGKSWKVDEQLDKNFYRQTGSRFETDNFRSDVYLEKEKDLFFPVFSEKHPIESYSNLFVAGLDTHFFSEARFNLYKGKKKAKMSFDAIQQHLSSNKEVFFGLYADSETALKATVIYYDALYKYIHMVVAEIEKETLFKNEKGELKMDVYLYIPRSDVNKEKIEMKR